MTLVLTELSTAGIAMAADSAITRLSNGTIDEIDQEGWRKILRVPKIRAAISYWGMIGSVTQVQFDIWLQRVIAEEDNYDNLAELAEYIVRKLNEACNNQPLNNGEDTGIHVAGYQQWADGVERPFFYHVHNGHGRFNVQEKRDNNGNLLSVNPIWQSDPRKLFEAHQDFPYPTQPIEMSLDVLQDGYITRNGAFFIYAVLWQQMQYAFQYINKIQNVSLPRDPSNISSRKGFLHIMLQMMIQFYRCSNQSRIVGGEVTSLGIGPNGYSL
jgi:hypothetical protein